MTMTFIASVGPSRTAMIGMSTGGGTARKNSSIGSSSSRSQRTSPISVPATMPTSDREDDADREATEARQDVGHERRPDPGVDERLEDDERAGEERLRATTDDQMPQITRSRIGSPRA